VSPAGRTSDRVEGHNADHNEPTASPVKEAIPTAPLHQPLSEGSTPPKGPSTSLANHLAVVAGTAVWFRPMSVPQYRWRRVGPHARPGTDIPISSPFPITVAGLRYRATDVPGRGQGISGDRGTRLGTFDPGSWGPIRGSWRKQL